MNSASFYGNRLASPYGGGHAKYAIKPRRNRRNDSERAQIIDNDEGLYNWWRESRLSKRQFIRENRRQIDRAIDAMEGGSRPQHFLAYPSPSRPCPVRFA